MFRDGQSRFAEQAPRQRHVVDGRLTVGAPRFREQRDVDRLFAAVTDRAVDVGLGGRLFQLLDRPAAVRPRIEVVLEVADHPGHRLQALLEFVHAVRRGLQLCDALLDVVRVSLRVVEPALDCREAVLDVVQFGRELLYLRVSVLRRGLRVGLLPDLDDPLADVPEFRLEVILDAVDVDVQLGGGIRTAEDAISLLSRGVDRVILGTAAVENPDIVAEIGEAYPDGVLVSLDAKGGEVVVSGWTEGTGLDPAEAARRYADLGAAGILFTDVDVEGRLEGVRTDPVERLVAAVDIPVIASGGVATIDDVLALEDAGAAAVVVGSALYEGEFTLEAAQRAVDGQ